MTAPTISDLPEVPPTNDADFETKAPALFNAIKNTFVGEVNDFGDYMNTELPKIEIRLDELSSTTGMTADAIKERDAGMSEAEFFALADERKNNRAGSGIDKLNEVSDYSDLNELFSGDFCVNGFEFQPEDITWAYPDAQTDENARQDLGGYELLIQQVSDFDFVFAKGDVQSELSTHSGVSTVSSSFTGANTYSVLGNWESSRTGKGWVWSTLSHADRMKVLQDKTNGLFWGEDGSLYQRVYRRRYIKGLTSSGAEWATSAFDFTTTLKYDASNYVAPKGKQTSITNDLRAASTDDYTGVTGEKLGHFITETVNTALAYKGHCYFLPITMLPRNKNQGAFHPTHNKNGAKKFSDGFWHETALSITSTADCLNASNLLTASGNISSGISGRPDGLYYDEINERDVRDLRLPTFYEEVTSARCNTELNKCFSNQNRGYEAEFEITHVIDVNLDFSAFGNVPIGDSTRVRTITRAITGSIDSTSYISKDSVILIEGDSQFYECNSIYDATTYNLLYLHPRHGNVSADFDTTGVTSYKLIVAQRSDSFSNNKITRCEIIGDPANYSFSNHVGVPNLLDVNDLSSNLPDGAKTAFRLHGKLKLRYKVLKNGLELSLTTDYTFSTTTNTITFVVAPLATDIIEVYYEGYANEFESSVRLAPENKAFTGFYDSSYNSVDYGAVVANELTGKILTGSSNPVGLNKNIDRHLFLSNGLLSTGNSTEPKTNDITEVYGASGVFGISSMCYLANVDGLLYPVLSFKEKRYDTDWGDSFTLPQSNNIVTTTDDNTKVITYGTVISKNPIGFAKGQ